MWVAERHHCSCDILCVAACWCTMLTCSDWQKSDCRSPAVYLPHLLLGRPVCTPWGVGGGGGREQTERGRERMGRIKLEWVEHQAISIISISLWICKPDRSSRHQWLSSLWNSKREEQRREKERSPPRLSSSRGALCDVCVRVCVKLCKGVSISLRLCYKWKSLAFVY